MKLVYKTGENITIANLDQLAVTYSGIVNIGRKCKEVWNTIAIEFVKKMNGLKTKL